MLVTQRARFAGAAGMIGGLVALALTPPFAAAFFLAYPGENSLPFWFETVEEQLDSALTFASPVDVYSLYGRFFNVVYLLLLPMVVVLHRAQAAPDRALERRGYRVLTTGIAAATVGVAGDYWLNGVGFPLEVLGLLAMIVGVTLWGVASIRTDVLPRLWSWLFLVCGPGALATSVLTGHLPSGPTLSFAVVWVIVGTLLVTRRASFVRS